MALPMPSETLELDYPVQLADRVLTEVTMRRPSMKDIRKHKITRDDDIDGELKMFADLCNLRVEELEAMDSADYTRLQRLYVRFRTPAERGTDTKRVTSGVDAGALGNG